MLRFMHPCRKTIPGGLWAGLLVGLLAVLPAAVCFSQTPSEDTRAYTVMGSSEVTAGNIENSRQRAIANGQAIAISLAVNDLVPVEVRVENFQTISQMLYDRVGEFVLGYRVLTEGRFGNIYRVLAEVTVSLRKVKDQLLSSGVLSAGKPILPSLLLLISEQSLEDPAPRYWWHAPAEIRQTYTQETMQQVLAERGFTVLDPASALGEHPEAAIADQADLNDAQAVEAGRLLQADVVLVGSALVEVAPNTMGAEVRTFKATVSVRALQVSDGQPIATVSREAVSVNADHRAGARTALTSAATLTAEDLAGQLAAVWSTRQERAGTVEIQVQGTANLGNFVHFRRTLAALPGVEQVQVQDLAADSATLAVTFKGDGPALAEALMRQTFTGFAIRIGEVLPDSLQVQLTPAAGGQAQ